MATRMDGNIGHGIVVGPDELQWVNPVLILILVSSTT